MPDLGARRWWALGALNLVVLAVALPVTVVSVALPTLAGALHASASDLQWFVSAYALAMAAALLPGGLLGDRYGRKKVLLGALVAYAGGSVAAAAATSPGAFIAAQAVLGLAAGLVIPLVLSALTVMFNDAERPRAVGIWAAANFVALPLGPILGGWMLSNYWWGWVFLMNLPVIAIALAAGAVLLPESRSARRPRLDLVGVLGSSAGLAVVTYGLVTAGKDGWGSAGALATITGGVLVLVAFAWWERWLDRRPAGQPLVDPGLFGSRHFTWGTVLAGVGNFALVGVLFTAPQYFQAILGTDAMGSGVRLLPLLAGITAGAVAADRVAARAGARLTVALGFTVLAAALTAGTLTTVTSGFGLAAAWTFGAGLGTGLVMTTATSAALGQLSAEHAGVGSATMQAIQKVGPPLSAAILGSALNSGYRSELDLAGLPAPVAGAARDSVFAGVEIARQLGSTPLLESVRAAFVHGLDVMLWISAGTAAAGIALALIFCRGGQPPSGTPSRPSTRNRTMRQAPDDRPAAGLRERKKARTKTAIQQQALRLFREQGYQATTVEQIAAAAEVAPSTVFRYFPTKEDLAVLDDYLSLLPDIVASFEAQPPDLHPVAAFRATLREVFAGLSPTERAARYERDLLMLVIPELWAANLGLITRGIQTLTELAAKRTGRDASDPAVRALTGGVVGVGLSVLFDWTNDPTMDPATALDEALAYLEAGLPV